MTALPPDPDPARIPGLEQGGGVPPGETPPDSSHMSATSNADPETGARRALTPTAVAVFVVIGVLVLIFAATAVVWILRIVGIV